MNFTIRAVTQADEPFLWQMLYEAAHLENEGEPLASAQANPALARYVVNWGRKDDAGVLALLPGTQEPIAAAWFRLLQGANKGYGYIDDQTPELAIATAPAYRSRGAGTAVLQALIQSARGQYPALSLSVRDTNPALSLYLRLGFQKVSGSEVTNRVGGQSFSMILWL